MKHLWGGVASAAMLSLAATASAQAPMSPSGAVNTTEPPSINFPSAPPSPPPSPPAPPSGAAARPAAEPATPAPSTAPTGTASKPSPETPGTAPAASAAPEEKTGERTVAAPPARETVVQRSRPKRPVHGAEREASRSAASRGERHSGDNVADMLNTRELNRLNTDAGPGSVARPFGPPSGYPRPPAYGPRPPGYGPPPAYAPYPPPMMRTPY